MRHFLEVDDLTGPTGGGAGPGRARPARPGPGRAGAWRSSSRSRPTGPATPPRWPSSASAATRQHPGRGDRPRCTREVEDVDPGPGPLPPRRRGPGVRSRRPGSHGRGRRGSDRQPAVRSGPSLPGPGRPAHPAPALGQLAGHTVAWVGDGNNVARSLTLACGLAGIDIRLACPAGHQLDPVAVDGARARGVDGHRHHRPGARRSTGRRGLHRRVGVDGPGGRAAPAPGRLRRLPGRRGPDEPGRARAPCSCTACPPIAARRSAPAVIDGPASACGSRPRTACTPPGASAVVARIEPR